MHEEKEIRMGIVRWSQFFRDKREAKQRSYSRLPSFKKLFEVGRDAIGVSLGGSIPRKMPSRFL